MRNKYSERIESTVLKAIFLFVAREISQPAMRLRGVVGAVERSEAAIFPQTLESQAKNQKIAGFASSYRDPSPQ